MAELLNNLASYSRHSKYTPLNKRISLSKQGNRKTENDNQITNRVFLTSEQIILNKSALKFLLCCFEVSLSLKQKIS